MRTIMTDIRWEFNPDEPKPNHIPIRMVIDIPETITGNTEKIEFMRKTAEKQTGMTLKHFKTEKLD